MFMASVHLCSTDQRTKEEEPKKSGSHKIGMWLSLEVLSFKTRKIALMEEQEYSD